MGPCLSTQDLKNGSSLPDINSQEETSFIKYLVERNNGKKIEINLDDVAKKAKNIAWKNYLSDKKFLEPRCKCFVFFEVDWSHVKYDDVKEESEIIWSEDTNKCRIYSNKMFCLEYINKTSEPQTYLMKTDQQTKTTFRGSLQKGITEKINGSLSLPLPKTIAQVSIGYAREVTLTREDETTKETAISWSVEGPIKVNSGSTVTADLKVSEEHREYLLKASTFLTGDIEVNIYKKCSKERKQRLYTSAHNVERLCREVYNLRNEDKMILKGRCCWKLITQQHMEVSENAIISKESCVQKTGQKSEDK